MRTGVPGPYGVYAAVFLVVTLLSGVWLRTAFLDVGVLAGFSFAHLLHAHSHVAFFGWTTMALFALLASAARLDPFARPLRLHAHAVGIASALAFVGFLHAGYTGFTIALAASHVGLWVIFILMAWRSLGAAGEVERRYYRAALLFLLLSGAGAVAPTIVRVRGIEDPWIKQLSVELFLTPFVSGWLLLGIAGAVYARLQRPRFAAAVLALTAAGVFPSLFLHLGAPPPAEWLTVAGRLGTLALGVAAVLFGIDVLQRGGALPLLRLVAAAALAKGALELLAALGVTLELVGSRPLVIAYLHLTLLGLVTPALLATGFALPPAPRRVAAYAAGLALMLGALAGMGWPAAGAWLGEVGVTTALLLRVALVGGAVSAVAAIALLVQLRPAPRRAVVLRCAHHTTETAASSNPNPVVRFQSPMHASGGRQRVANPP